MACPCIPYAANATQPPPAGPLESQQARREAKKLRRAALLQKRKQEAAWQAATQRAGHWYEVSAMWRPGAWLCICEFGMMRQGQRAPATQSCAARLSAGMR